MPERAHLSKHYEQRLGLLRDRLLLMGGEAEQMIADAIRALVSRCPSLALEVIGRDDDLDALEIEIDSLCYEILALDKPVARDLRYVTTALKIVGDIERVGDIAVNIAERAIELSNESDLQRLMTVPLMADEAQNALRLSLDASVNADALLAAAVVQTDGEIDAAYQRILNELVAFMQQDAARVSRCLKLIFVAKHLERVGDHSANIAEMVIFMVEGQDLRHHLHSNLAPLKEPA